MVNEYSVKNKHYLNLLFTKSKYPFDEEAVWLPDARSLCFMRFYVYLPCIPPLQKYEHSEASTRIHYILQVRDLNCVMTQADITEWWELVYKSQN